MHTTHIKMSRGDKVFVTFNYLFVIIATLLVLYPLIYIISGSVYDPKLVNSGAMGLLPKGYTWVGYAKILANQDNRIDRNGVVQGKRVDTGGR